MAKRTFYHCINCGKQLPYQGKKQKSFRCGKCAAQNRIETKPWSLPSNTGKGFKKDNQYGNKFIKGQLPTIGSFKKGHKHSFEVWLKLKKANIGKRVSIATEFKQKSKIKKLKHNRQKYDIQHVKWRQKVFLRDNWTCQKCNQHGHVHAHHKKAWQDYPALRYKLENGITLCPRCHKLSHGYKHKTGKIYK